MSRVHGAHDGVGVTHGGHMSVISGSGHSHSGQLSDMSPG